MTLESGIFKALYLGSTDLKKNEISKVNGHNCSSVSCLQYVTEQFIRVLLTSKKWRLQCGCSVQTSV